MTDTHLVRWNSRRGLHGAFEGAFYLGVFGFVAHLVATRHLVAALQMALIAAGCGAIAFGIGRALCDRWFGAFMGSLLGIILFGQLGDRWIGYSSYSLDKPAPSVVNGQELYIAGPTLQGPPFDIVTLRGKVVLVDFWATWCGPCMAELPNVREVYDRYHTNGFEVVGVSLDNSRDSLADIVALTQTPWPQVFFDEKRNQGWDNPLVKQYEIDSVPTTFLVDQTGRVVASNVRGPDLAPTVARLLGKESPNTIVTETARHRVGLFAVGQLIGSVFGCLAGSLCGALL